MTEDKDIKRFEFEIGGRSTDFTQIGYSLLWEIKNYFPANKIPVDLLERVENFIKMCEILEKDYDYILKKWDSYNN